MSFVGPAPSRDVPVAARLEALEKRFATIEPVVRAWVDEPDRFARLAVEAADGHGPFAGLLVGAKDVFRVDGLPTRAGTSLPPEDFAGPESEAVRRLRAAGAIVVGKTVSTELAYFAPGPTCNPWNPEHTPGGSSSGSAAAVAAGLCDVALGTQTIGSVCRPASFCGVVGYKPTRGRIPIDGVVPLGSTFDHVGVFAPDVELVESVAPVLVDGWARAPLGEVPRPCVGIPVGPYLDRAGAAMRRMLAAAVDQWRASGGEVVDVTLFADFEEIEARHRRILARDFRRDHGERIAARPDDFAPKTRQLAEAGASVSDERLADDLAAVEALARHVEAVRVEAGVDVWWTPAAVGPAPRGLESTGDPVMNLPWTQIGVPTVSVPHGSQDGLPLGLQWVGGPGGDEILLARIGTWTGEAR